MSAIPEEYIQKCLAICDDHPICIQHCHCDCYYINEFDDPTVIVSVAHRCILDGLLRHTGYYMNDVGECILDGSDKDCFDRSAGDEGYRQCCHKLFATVCNIDYGKISSYNNDLGFSINSTEIPNQWITVTRIN